MDTMPMDLAAVSGAAMVSPDDALAMLAAAGDCDVISIERARAVARETGISNWQALARLGLVAERALAENLAGMLRQEVALPEHYPSAPVLPERLRGLFLRAARAVPLAIAPDERGRNVLRLAMADPFDGFTPAAITLATGLAARVEVAVPIELDGALDRLYPEAAAPTPAGHAPAGEEDAERLRDMASEAPVIRLVNQMIARAVESAASDLHIEPFEDRLRIRYRHDGALARGEVFPARLIRLLRLGEATAQVGKLAVRAADQHEERMRGALNRLVALAVPAITIAMGAAVGGIVSSLLVAMLSLNNLAQ